jgi:Zn-dependent protease with chaperone function
MTRARAARSRLPAHSTHADLPARARIARVAGHLEPGLGAVVVEHPQPAAYCVGGRCPTVIVTTGAMVALAPGQFDAVLAHERAHLAGRHHALKAAARIGRQVLLFLPLLRDAEAQVARLAELHADDAATRTADPRDLATALVALATPAHVTPAPALGAAATDAVQRIHRLFGPAGPAAPAPAARRRRCARIRPPC